jgi:hypothetical protein
MERGTPVPPFAERAAEDCRAPDYQILFTPRIAGFFKFKHASDFARAAQLACLRGAVANTI